MREVWRHLTPPASGGTAQVSLSGDTEEEEETRRKEDDGRMTENFEDVGEWVVVVTLGGVGGLVDCDSSRSHLCLHRSCSRPLRASS